MCLYHVSILCISLLISLFRHDEQIAALEQKYHDISAEIASFKRSSLVSTAAQPQSVPSHY